MSGVTRHPRLPHSCSGCCPDCSTCHPRARACPPIGSSLLRDLATAIAIAIVVSLPSCLLLVAAFR